MVTKEASENLRATLLREQADLRQRIDELDIHKSGSLKFDENFADSGQVAAEQGENQALAAILQEQLDDVERALAHIDGGDYGLCEQCGEPIDDSRLEAVPAARFCITHA